MARRRRFLFHSHSDGCLLRLRHEIYFRLCFSLFSNTTTRPVKLEIESMRAQLSNKEVCRWLDASCIPNLKL